MQDNYDNDTYRSPENYRNFLFLSLDTNAIHYIVLAHVTKPNQLDARLNEVMHHTSLSEVLWLSPHCLAHHGIHVHEPILILTTWCYHGLFPFGRLSSTYPIT